MAPKYHIILQNTKLYQIKKISKRMISYDHIYMHVEIIGREEKSAKNYKMKGDH